MLNVNLDRQPDIRFQDGALSHATGVRSYQILRANRAHPESSDGFGYTYNHAPMLAWYHGAYYVQYLSSPQSEHEAPGHTLICRSLDGINWSFPEVAFPSIEVDLTPYKGKRAENMPASVMSVPHQRMGFYCASNDCMLTLSFYGIVHDRRLSAPCDGFGVGRAVRRIYADGSMGEIFFLIYNEPAGYTKENVNAFGFFEDGNDDDLIFACRELLKNRPVLNQMYEEQKYDARLFDRKLEKAPCFYSLNDNEMITVFKRGLSMYSDDGGLSFGEIAANPTLKTATGKVWGQRAQDGSFVLMYNPSPDGHHRWPIAIVSGDDGLNFSGMRAVTGYMSPQRYGGLDKNLGPQYMRGICEGNPEPQDGLLRIVYSNNKEDIWISQLPPQTNIEAESEIRERFYGSNACNLGRWSVYSPKWAPVRFTDEGIELRDFDPCDRALAERNFAPTRAGSLKLCLNISQISENSEVCIEISDKIGAAAITLTINSKFEIEARSGGRNVKFANASADNPIRLTISFDCSTGRYLLEYADRRAYFELNAASDELERISIATKDIFSAAPNRFRPSDIYSCGKYGSHETDLAGTDVKTHETRVLLREFEFEKLS